MFPIKTLSLLNSPVPSFGTKRRKRIPKRCNLKLRNQIRTQAFKSWLGSLQVLVATWVHWLFHHPSGLSAPPMCQREDTIEHNPNLETQERNNTQETSHENNTCTRTERHSSNKNLKSLPKNKRFIEFPGQKQDSDIMTETSHRGLEIGTRVENVHQGTSSNLNPMSTGKIRNSQRANKWALRA